MQVVHSCYVSGQHPKHKVVSTLGRYDEKQYMQIQQILRDMQRLQRAQEIISEINNPEALPDKSHHRKVGFKRAGGKGRQGGFSSGTS